MKNIQGFTLVEVMVTIMMAGIATAALSSMFISIRNIQLQAGYFDTATRSAGREIESLRNDNYDSLTPGSTIDFSSNLPASLSHATGKAVISSPAADIRRIDATVTYRAEGQTRTIELSSLIGVIGISQ